ncbi:type II toxin-antitoxin system VapC family toxin [Labrys okinawensis]|uniref:type II toxin-antitoxin system VapC family toxin n=1 Tax=Labrys okinawensis TaxID=346911 RepID=UPI0039BC3123
MKYLLDTNLIKEIGRVSPHPNVKSRLANVNDTQLAISVISIREIWKGIEKKRLSDTDLAGRLEQAANDIRLAYQGRILAIDEGIAIRWGEMLGQSEKHIEDTGLAAIAQIHGLVLVTRNVSDVRGRGVDILDPFKQPPQLHKAEPSPRS